MGKAEVVAKGSGGPGSCEDAMGTAEEAAGGVYKCSAAFQEHVVVDGNLITGQNPASSGALATAVLYAFDTVRKEFEPPRAALLAEREPLAADIETKREEFTIALNRLKGDEEKNAEKIENLQMLAVATRDWMMGHLKTVDDKLECLAVQRQAAVDKYNKILADAAAAEAEEA